MSVQTELPAAGPAAGTVSPLLVTRVAGLPADTLDLVPARTRDLLARHAGLTGELEAAAEPLVDALFALVPLLDAEVGLRRHVLAGKRAVHRLLPLPWTGEVEGRLRALLPAPGVAALDRWSELGAARAEVVAALRTAARADAARTVDRLHELLSDPAYLAALAVAAPDWLRHARPEQRRSGSARTLKTLLLYAARAGVKTSPFAGLTTVGTAGVGSGRARSRVTVSVAPLLLDVLAHDERTAGLLRFRVAPHRPGGPGQPDGLVLHSQSVAAAGIAWRDDRVTEADRALPWLHLLRPVSEDGLRLDEVLDRVGGGFERYVRLLDSGILAVLPPWRRDQDPLAVLAELVGGGASPVPGAELRLVHELGAAVAAAGTRERIRIAAEVDRAVASWAGAGSARPSGLIFEDRETDLDLPDPLRAPSVAADLRQLAARVRPLVYRSHVYDLLVERFVAEAGPGGSSADPLGFLMRAALERESDLPMARARFADLTVPADVGTRARLPVGPTSSGPSAGLMFQLAAGSGADVAAGRHLTVIGQFTAGSGGVVSRFAPLLGRSLTARYAEHLEQRWPGVPRRELVVWTDCNTGQAESGGILPPLLLPGEPRAAGGLRLEDTVLVHDAATDTLSLCERDGQPFGLAYLGISPRHLLTGYLGLLGVLADPWVNASADADTAPAHAAGLGRAHGAEVSFQPRVQHGRLVTRRAAWVVPVDRLPRLDDSADEATTILRLDRFRREHGIPEEVFVHQLGGIGAPMSGAHKPIWVSWASAPAVRVLLQWLERPTTHLRVVEVLPARADHPVRDRAGRRRVTEHVAHLSWDRPGTVR